ncbi:MOSC domain-containing protein [Halieaceae bacterium IMCC14734]|uniref:MOSC domain-containing protein n=1 Tax=Candidatus Litorirhabdus singularis TaxID=2518993 RepID=A0ABT3TKW0_9GAMM|nr:MOSC N-terminal beta barrel domain-containing protein [Candidatus Litorirhabdus singularis]MCX2982049.1 MOSC domain-containing protein [Candidatus Litorirhabdus singularis]
MKIQIGTVKELWRYPVKSMQGELLQQAQIEKIGLIGDRSWAIRDEATNEINGVRKLPRLLNCTARFEGQPLPGQTGSDVPAVQVQLPDGTLFLSRDQQSSKLLSAYLKKEVSLQPVQPKSDKEFYRLKTLTGEQAMKKQFDARGGMPSLGSLSWSKMLELGSYVTPRGSLYDVYPLHILTSNSIAMLNSLEPEADFQPRRFRPNIYIESAQKSNNLDEFDWVGGALFIGDTVIKCESRTVRCSMPAQPQPGLEKDSKVLRTLEKHTERHLGINASVLRGGCIRDGDPVFWKPESRLSPRRYFQPVSDRIKNSLIQRGLKAIDDKAKS